MRPATISYPNGRIVNYNYSGNDANNLNRISGVVTGTFGGGGAVQSSYKYLGMNTVVEVDHEEPDVKLDLIGSAHAYSGFDRFGRVIDQKWRDYGSLVDADRYTYGYDRASNRRYRENTLTAAKDEFYTYDGVHRLSVADRGDLNAGKTAITGTPPRKFTYELDPTGNWNAYTIQNSGALELLQGRTHNKANETDGGADDFQTVAGTDWANVTHDANGNTTILPQPNSLGSAYTLTYDAWNRVTKVQNGGATVADYSYDGLNHRITKTASGTLRHFYYSDQWQVVEERIGSDPDPADHYIWGLRYVDDLILRDRDTAATPDGTFDQRHYYLQDANFNVTAITNHTGDVQERYVYEPYGAVSYFTAAWASSSASFANPYQFTGRRLDAETGIYYYRNRMYHAQLGRFLSRDPIGYVGSKSNLQQVSDSNPVDRVDPLGLVSMSDCRRFGVECKVRCMEEHLSGTIFVNQDLLDCYRGCEEKTTACIRYVARQGLRNHLEQDCCLRLRSVSERKVCFQQVQEVLNSLDESRREIVRQGGASRFSFNGPVCTDCEFIVLQKFPALQVDIRTPEYFTYETVTKERGADHVWGRIRCQVTDSVVATIDFWSNQDYYWREGKTGFPRYIGGCWVPDSER